MDNIINLQSKINSLESQTNSLVSDKEFNIELFLKHHKNKIAIYSGILFLLYIIRPSFIMTKKLKMGNISYDIDYNKFFIWSIVLFGCVIGVMAFKKVKDF